MNSGDGHHLCRQPACELRGTPLRCYDEPRRAVGYDVLHLIIAQHGVDRNENSTSKTRRKDGDALIEALGQDDRDAVAAAKTQLDQADGQSIHTVVELAARKARVILEKKRLLAIRDTGAHEMMEQVGFHFPASRPAFAQD
jgi:hypothetical protein